ncbi:COMTD1 [Bugula neritina]|uniref:COMTD1 n=1 Tax=Bugula neritina TaxID=10212 RepID=A0A7J7JBC2_BUGNE|nr:COMTD1 [Bugula neritina]
MNHPREYGSDQQRRTYINSHMSELHPVMKKLRQLMETHPRGFIMSDPNPIMVLSNMLKLAAAKKCIEVGVFTGYSSLAWALSMPEDGKVVACDISTEYTDIGKPFWKEAGVDHKIDLRIAPAVETLQSLIESEESGTFDFIYVDGDKLNADVIYELSLKLLRTNGIIAFDNSFMHGHLLKPEDEDERQDVSVIRKLNVKIQQDSRVAAVMLDVADGVYVCRKN